MAHAYSIPEDLSFYTRYGQGTARLEPPSHPLRNSLLAAVAAFAFGGLAITYGIHKLPPVEALDYGRTAAALAAEDPHSRTLLETLPPEIAAQARTQPVPVAASVQAPSIPATLYAQPASQDIAYDDDQQADTDDTAQAAPQSDTVADQSDAVVDDPPADEPQTTDQM